jgi:hypothetical protein
MAYNFSKTKAATANQYLNPGIYKLKVAEVTKDKFSKKGTPYLGIKFENEDGLSFVEKFSFGSDKSSEVAMTRLQYIHLGFFGKECEKEFKNLDEIVAYFDRALTGGKKTIVKTIVVGGNESGNTVFACLPYAGFILDDDSEAELGEFDPGSKEYKKVVTKNTSTSEVAEKANGLLNDSEDDEEIGAKKNGAKKPEVAKAKGATKPAPKEEEDEADDKEDDDMPW